MKWLIGAVALMGCSSAGEVSNVSRPDESTAKAMPSIVTHTFRADDDIPYTDACAKVWQASREVEKWGDPYAETRNLVRFSRIGQHGAAVATPDIVATYDLNDQGVWQHCTVPVRWRVRVWNPLIKIPSGYARYEKILSHDGTQIRSGRQVIGGLDVLYLDALSDVRPYTMTLKWSIDREPLTEAELDTLQASLHIPKEQEIEVREEALIDPYGVSFGAEGPERVLWGLVGGNMRAAYGDNMHVVASNAPTASPESLEQASDFFPLGNARLWNTKYQAEVPCVARDHRVKWHDQCEGVFLYEIEKIRQASLLQGLPLYVSLLFHADDGNLVLQSIIDASGSVKILSLDWKTIDELPSFDDVDRFALNY